MDGTECVRRYAYTGSHRVTCSAPCRKKRRLTPSRRGIATSRRQAAEGPAPPSRCATVADASGLLCIRDLGLRETSFWQMTTACELAIAALVGDRIKAHRGEYGGKPGPRWPSLVLQKNTDSYSFQPTCMSA
ncbi:hypothetical protein BDW02DRAFT_54522 [Decorospora gaudefroyi]|uniref:Uncharacterized protein n=1 Tax=Decorospora gaudefroyi TaxID=184978 RepID=A0A6A5K8Z5_9PLEO|nr:hypothetical protein BDW02DRAFT_54522 [Decorospora gaudefroyi]